MKPQTHTSAVSEQLVSSNPLCWTDIELLELTRSGMRFRSHRAFDLGDSLRLGVHLTLGPKQKGQAPVLSDFLTIEGSVIECRVSSWGTADRVFEVTLLFQSVDEDDRTLLLDVAMRRGNGRKSLLPQRVQDPDSEPPFHRITGLN